MIDLTVDPKGLENAVRRARERGVVIPTLAQMIDPSKIPASVVQKLRGVGLWDVDPVNLFRINWHNEPVEKGGGFGAPNFIELPPELTGVEARVVAMVGKWFPTGAHKVGAAFGCLVPRLVTGQFDPTTHKAVWPSTGNYCRGGAYDSALLGCESIAILPAGMSRERFAWLEKVAGEVIKTPGTESNVKEIFDKCWELRKSGQALTIFNQFEEMGNYLWHHEVTGRAMAEVAERLLGPRGKMAGLAVTTGSAGTIASGDYLKKRFPGAKIAASEAAECPTLLRNGFGEHRIEGIGDKHVPWIHNVRNTDMVMAIQDEAALSMIRLFNEPEGKRHLASRGVSPEVIERLPLIGISGAANILSAIKMAKWYELGRESVVMTVLTDSIDMYRSRLEEMRQTRGEFLALHAAVAHERWVLGAGTDLIEELTYPDRKRVHNLKYYTWVEQQGRTHEEIQALWSEDTWASVPAQAGELDRLIDEFNARTGLAAH
ncbi:MAG: pyridoxal-phosphate dependent enzyme [Deltaproteobacteria bacterium]|nr:pyridoxal-phosphate dependent enzyme [Deltaproteobacteria bacterium]